MGDANLWLIAMSQGTLRAQALQLGSGGNQGEGEDDGTSLKPILLVTITIVL